jgi:hypothetical protein
VLILDNVFSELGAEAVHCRSCRSEHHGIGDISL